MIIINNDGRFWLGKRIGTEAWQFPQGGIDKGEKVREAMYRELQEETGLEKETVEIISISKTMVGLSHTSCLSRDIIRSLMAQCRNGIC